MVVESCDFSAGVVSGLTKEKHSCSVMDFLMVLKQDRSESGVQVDWVVVRAYHGRAAVL